MICMATERLTISVDTELGKAIRGVAAAMGTSVSAWMAVAAQETMRNIRLGEALDEWQAEDGVFTDDELRIAAKLLGSRRS